MPPPYFSNIYPSLIPISRLRSTKKSKRTFFQIKKYKNLCKKVKNHCVTSRDNYCKQKINSGSGQVPDSTQNGFDLESNKLTS